MEARAGTEARLELPERVELRDGSAVQIRPIEPDDIDALLRGFQALSPESRYRRFLAPLNRLSDEQLRYLTVVDHHDHEALVAVSDPDEEPVGAARFIRAEDRPSTASRPPSWPTTTTCWSCSRRSARSACATARAA